MSTLKHLYAAYGELLNEKQSAAIQEYIAREDAGVAYALPSGEPTWVDASGFIIFERVASGTPTLLFGQDVPSLAHTKISVYRSKESAGELVPDTIVLSALISELQLTKAMFNTHRSEASPLTYTQLLTDKLPPRRQSATMMKIASEEYDKESTARALKTIDAFIEGIGEDLRPSTKLKKQAEDLAFVLRDTSSGSFDGKTHLEGLGEIKVALLAEATHAANNAERISRSSPVPLLEASTLDVGELVRTNPLANDLMDDLPSGYTEAVAILIKAQFLAFAEENPRFHELIAETETGATSFSIPAARDRSFLLHGTRNNDETKQLLDNIASLWNHASNPSIAARRADLNPLHGALNIGNRQGSTDHIHKSLAIDDNHYFSIEFVAGYVENTFGRAQIRGAYTPIISVEISANDLMTALRGHPDGKPVPCSFRHIMRVPLAGMRSPRNAIEKNIDQIDMVIKKAPAYAKAEAALRFVVEIAGAKRSGKAWREELLIAAAAFRGCILELIEETNNAVDEGNERTTAEMRRIVGDMLTDVAKYLPPAAIQVLGLDSGNNTKENK